MDAENLCPFCGSSVDGDAAQLEHLVRCNPGHLIEVLERRYGSAWHTESGYIEPFIVAGVCFFIGAFGFFWLFFRAV